MVWLMEEKSFKNIQVLEWFMLKCFECTSWDWMNNNFYFDLKKIIIYQDVENNITEWKVTKNAFNTICCIYFYFLFFLLSKNIFIMMPSAFWTFVLLLSIYMLTIYYFEKALVYHDLNSTVIPRECIIYFILNWKILQNGSLQFNGLIYGLNLVNVY